MLKVRDKIVDSLGYPESSIRIEYQISEGYRADLVVLGADSQPWLVAEAKSKLHLASARNELELYMSKLGARYGILTDGIVDYCYSRLKSGEISEIPSVPRFSEGFRRSNTTQLKALDQPTSKFYRIADILQLQPLPFETAILEVAKILLAKFIAEERQNLADLFYLDDQTERPNGDYHKETKGRIEQLFQLAKKRYPDVFPVDEHIQLDDVAVSRLVGELQSYSIHQDPVAFCRGMQELSRFGTKSLAEFYTPENIVTFMVDMLAPTKTDTVIDPACGAGSLLLGFIDYVMKSDVSISEYAKKVFGFDISARMICLAKTKMILRGGVYSNILQQDALLEIASPIVNTILKNGGFDLVILDPPMGLRLHQTKGFELAEGKAAAQSTILFLERALQLVKEGGRVAILVPEELLSGRRFQYVRSFLMRKARILAVISLPASPPYLESRISALFLEKVTEPAGPDYEVFMGSVENEDAFFEVVCAFNRRASIAYATFAKLASLRQGLNPNYQPSRAPTRGVLLETLVRIRRGALVSSKEYVQDRKGIPYIRISDMSEGSISIGSIKRVRKSVSVPPKARVKTNEVLFSIDGTIGKAAIVPKLLDGAIASPHLAILTTDQKIVRTKFLLRYLSSKYVSDQVARIWTGTVIRHVSIYDLRRLRLVIPPISRQDELLKALDKLDKQTSSWEVKQEAVEREFAGLLEE